MVKGRRHDLVNIDPTLLLGNQTAKKQTGSQTLGKDDFLKLLVTQLKMQDPLEPMKDKEFISQMATFTSLEQTTNMTNLLTQFVQSQSSHTLSDQAQMIGKTISWTLSDSNTGESQTVSGIVNAVTLKNGKTTYVTQDGAEVDPSMVTSIENTPNTENTPTASTGGGTA
jgi:flagellar basal-body rod modification protein FlgD